MNWPPLILGSVLVIAGVIVTDIGTSLRELLGLLLIIVGINAIYHSQKRDTK